MREKLAIRAFEGAAAAGEIRLKLLDTLRRTETPQLTEKNHSRHALLDTLSNIRGVHFSAQNGPSGEVSSPDFCGHPVAQALLPVRFGSAQNAADAANR